MQKTGKGPAKNVDQYLEELPAEVKNTLVKIRKAIRLAVPEAEEVVSYHMPIYKYHGHLVGFAAFKNHCSFFPMSHAVMKTFKEELKDYDTSGATIRFPFGKPLPAKLIKKIIKVRIIENEEIAYQREQKKKSKK
ncbi:MAG: DUF1801 domain-containing protein [Chitinophagaceae bacterium]|nr:MAG: DUF1801 domain-containing protein [Chitinophagaceae bacterium]